MPCEKGKRTERPCAFLFLEISRFAWYTPPASNRTGMQAGFARPAQQGNLGENPWRGRHCEAEKGTDCRGALAPLAMTGFFPKSENLPGQ